MAYIAGAGIFLAMAALILIALGAADSNLTTSLLIVGLVILALGTAGWLYFLRPWQKFDDLKTPYYTGHHEPAAVKTAEPVAELVTEPVVAAVTEPAVVKAEEPAAVVTKPIRKAAAQSEIVKAAEPVAEAVVATAAEPAKPDDLTLIEGIGPKSAAALAAGGVTTFAQVAALTPAALEALVKGQKVRLVGSTASWPSQARLAAAGELTALEDLQRRIKSGGKVHDDLTQIEGVGPKAQEALYQAGLLTYQDIAQVAPDTLRLILAGAGLTTLNPDRWPEQAVLAAGHDLTGLKKLQDDL
jgi:predicted flap endonuclease-1-like 5' DNA nuclease